MKNIFKKITIISIIIILSFCMSCKKNNTSDQNRYFNQNILDYKSNMNISSENSSKQNINTNQNLSLNNLDIIDDRRYLIYTAYISGKVTNIDNFEKNITTEIEKFNGYIFTIDKENGNTIYITYKIPAEKFKINLDSIKKYFLTIENQNIRGYYSTIYRSFCKIKLKNRG